jgi:hypothetical protein
MTVKQVGRTTNSVTINVSGITEGNRQTYIWMPSTILNSSSGDWLTLSSAATKGYVTSIVTDFETNNGDITVVLPAKYYKDFKVVQFEVHNVDTKSGDSAIFISTILKFEFENNPDGKKVSGEAIDITVNDLKEINKFGWNIAYWMCNDKNGKPTHDGLHYTLAGVVSGDPIYAFYMSQPASNIAYAADFNIAHFVGTSYDAVYTNSYNVSKRCVSGADFKALYFNQIKDAINYFNLTVTT